MMEIYAFQAGSLQEAVQRVRSALGPDAAVLQVRELPVGLFGRLSGINRVEVLAAAGMAIPSRLPPASVSPESWGQATADDEGERAAAGACPELDFHSRFLQAAERGRGDEPSLVETLADFARLQRRLEQLVPAEEAEQPSEGQS